MLKIETTRSDPHEVTYKLSGSLTSEGLPTPRARLDVGPREGRAATLDLADLTGVDRDCVELLTGAPGRRLRLLHCPAYLEEWRRAEQARRSAARGRTGRLALAAATLLAARSALA